MPHMVANPVTLPLSAWPAALVSDVAAGSESRALMAACIAAMAALSASAFAGVGLGLSGMAPILSRGAAS